MVIPAGCHGDSWGKVAQLIKKAPSLVGRSESLRPCLVRVSAASILIPLPQQRSFVEGVRTSIAPSPVVVSRL